MSDLERVLLKFINHEGELHMNYECTHLLMTWIRNVDSIQKSQHELIVDVQDSIDTFIQQCEAPKKGDKDEI